MKNLILVPAYNEAKSIVTTLKDLEALGDNFEVLIVDDGSTDDTYTLAREAASNSRLTIHVARLPVNFGIGVAVQTGYRFAMRNQCYKYVIQCDADGQHPAASIPVLVDACDRLSLDICIGSRFLEDRQSNFRSTFLRRIGIRFFSWLIYLLCKQRLTDPTSGFRCLGPRDWRHFADQYPDDYPEPESLLWAARHGLRIGEVSVNMSERTSGRSSINVSRAFYYMLKVPFAMLIDRCRHKEFSQ